MGLNPSDNFDIFTNVGADKVQQARNAWYASHGLGTSTQNSGCAGVILALIVSISITLFSLI